MKVVLNFKKNNYHTLLEFFYVLAITYLNGLSNT
jgi:hypothetical protein